MESRHLVHAVVVRDGEVAEAGAIRASASSAPRRSRSRRFRSSRSNCPTTSSRSRAPRTRRGRSSSSPSVRSSPRRRRDRGPRVQAEHGSKLRHNCSGKHAGFLPRAPAGLVVGGLSPAGAPGAAECPRARRRGGRATPRTSTRPSTAAACRPSRSPSSRWRVSWRPRSRGARGRGRRCAGDDCPPAADRRARRRRHARHAGAAGVGRQARGRGRPVVGLADGAGVALKVDDGANRAAYTPRRASSWASPSSGRPVRNSRVRQLARSRRPPENSYPTFPQSL